MFDIKGRRFLYIIKCSIFKREQGTGHIFALGVLKKDEENLKWILKSGEKTKFSKYYFLDANYPKSDSVKIAQSPTYFIGAKHCLTSSVLLKRS